MKLIERIRRAWRRRQIESEIRYLDAQLTFAKRAYSFSGSFELAFRLGALRNELKALNSLETK